ncbi:MAG: STT3 domain-containing protein [Candidatus Omnitrophica bacterium]|nr:STT3 domain-containing protein [Candidatus Omnitrophota bacterium]MDD5671566.1 STT3 domain-containing protein [Candidatus Omnitrophota bacterium]
MATKRIIGYLAAVVFVMAVAFYFRTILLREPSSFELRGMKKLAEMTVRESLQTKLAVALEARMSGMSPGEKEKMAAERLRLIIDQDRDRYETSVARLMKIFIDARNTANVSRYFLGSDSYYYYYLARRIQQNGRLAPVKDGTFFDPLRHYPFGAWDRLTFHPYVGFIFYRFLHAAWPPISLQSACAFFPVFAVFLIVLLYFYLARVLDFRWISAFVGCVSFALAPIVLRRTTFGWFDDDPYKLFFPLVILTFFFIFLKKGNRAWLWGSLGGVSAGIFALFYSGSSYLSYLIFLVLAVLVFGSRPGWRFWKENPFFHFFLAYSLCSVAIDMLLRSPAAFLNSFQRTFDFLFHAGVSEESPWPKILNLVGETDSPGFFHWLSLTGNIWVLLIAIAGGFYLTRDVMKHKSKSVFVFRQWLVLTILTIPLLVLSFRMERFALLFCLPFSLWVAWGTGYLQDILMNLWARRPLQGLPMRLKQGLTILCLLLISLPPTLGKAQTMAQGMRPIMSDTWDGVLQYIRDKTPQGSPIVSYWDPGYFIISLGERPVVLDGGTQHLADNYWIARALITPNPREALGIFRMVLTSDDRAVEFLRSLGWPLQDAVSLIAGILALDRGQASSKLPADWSETDRNRFLDLTHSRGELPPAYLLLYNDLVEKNFLLQVVARWNFNKAKALQSGAVRRRSPMYSYLKQTMGEEFAQWADMAGGLLRFESPALWIETKDDNLIFANGLIVNEKTNEAFCPVAAGKEMSMQPVNLIYQDQGQWMEKKNVTEGQTLTAIVFRQDKLPASVILDSTLAASAVFRGYYLNGWGVPFLVPEITREDRDRHTQICLFKIDWKAFEPASEAQTYPSVENP